MFPVAAVAAAGWLLLFIVLLVVPPSPGPRRGGGLEGGTAPVPPPGGDEPPAVISLLAGKLDKLGFGATLIDLAARGWFQVSAAAGPGAGRTRDRSLGTGGPGHVRGARRDAGRAARAVRAARGGARGAAGGRSRRGARPGPVGRLRGRGNRLHEGVPRGGRRRRAPARADQAPAQRAPDRPAVRCCCSSRPERCSSPSPPRTGTARWPTRAVSYLVGCGVTIGVGTSRRRSAAGQEALDRWRSAVAGAPGGAASLAASGGGGRLLAYAAALGAAPAAVAVFAPGGTNVAGPATAEAGSRSRSRRTRGPGRGPSSSCWPSSSARFSTSSW